MQGARHFPPLWSLSMGMITPPTSQGNKEDSREMRLANSTGRWGPQVQNPLMMLFLLSSLGRSKPIDKMPSQPLPHTSCPHQLRRPPSGPVPALSGLQHPLGLHLPTCPPSSGTSATPSPGSFPSVYKCSQASLIQKHRYSKINI